MRNKDLKNLIKSKADEIVIADKSSEILQNVKTSPVNEPVITRKPRANKTFYARIGAFATVIVALIIAIVLPIALSYQGSGNGTNLTKTQQVLSKEVFALGNLIKDDDSLLSTVSDGADGDSALKEQFEGIAKKINGYLLSADAFLSSSKISAKYENNKDENFESYAKKLTVSYTDSDDYSVAYTLYYNETEQSATTVTLDGVMVLGSSSFEVWSEWKNEGDEVEMEFRVYLDEFRYFSIENETEVNENEYEYGYYEFGFMTFGVSLSVSTENGAKEIEMEITEGGLETEINFVYDDKVIHCSYENVGFKTSFDIRHENDTYEYDFGFEFKIALNK